MPCGPEVGRIRKKVQLRNRFFLSEKPTTLEADTFEIFRQSMLEKKGKLPKWYDGPVYENPPGVIFSWP